MSLHKGTDIFNTVNSVASAFGGFEKLSAVTDGAPTMQGKHRFRMAPIYA